jgi:plasmid stability protein
MPAITIRNVPDDLYRTLVKLAGRNRRSLQQQLLVILEQARVLDDDSPLEKASRIRRKLAGRKLGNSVAELREERAR